VHRDVAGGVRGAADEPIDLNLNLNLNLDFDFDFDFDFGLDLGLDFGNGLRYQNQQRDACTIIV